MSALSTIHAPVLGRHGWIARRYTPQPTASGRAASSCTATTTHKVWIYGWQRGRTLFLEPHLCLHDTRQLEVDGQGVLW